jgi:hypothetical protein
LAPGNGVIGSDDAVGGDPHGVDLSGDVEPGHHPGASRSCRGDVDDDRRVSDLHGIGKPEGRRINHRRRPQSGTGDR